jgi:hypothetical protein
LKGDRQWFSATAKERQRHPAPAVLPYLFLFLYGVTPRMIVWALGFGARGGEKASQREGKKKSWLAPPIDSRVFRKAVGTTEPAALLFLFGNADQALLLSFLRQPLVTGVSNQRGQSVSLDSMSPSRQITSLGVRLLRARGLGFSNVMTKQSRPILLRSHTMQPEQQTS